MGIEERPFKRLTKRLLAPSTPINSFLARKAPSDETITVSDPDATAQTEQFLKEIRRFREDAILDFAAFESSIARIQFLRAANKRERERYVAEREKIEATAQEVRDNTASLRIQLDEAQKMLAVRKTYDVLADAITKNAALKPRDEQHVNIEKLKAEIEELEREQVEHTAAWAERREVFERVLSEGMRLRRVIREEKEVEKEEGEDEEREHEGEGEGRERENEDMLGVGRDRDGVSHAGTPRPIDDAPTPLPIGLRGSGALTPHSHLMEGGATPRRVDEEDIDMEAGIVEEGESKTENAIVGEKTGDEMDTT